MFKSVGKINIYHHKSVEKSNINKMRSLKNGLKRAFLKLARPLLYIKA